MMLPPLRTQICSMFAGLALLAVSTIAWAEDQTGSWSQFRGPQGNGVSSEVHPIQWSDTENVAWSTEIAGGGWSSPVAAKGRIFLTSAVSTSGMRPKGFGEGVSSMRSHFQSGPPSAPLSFQVLCLNLTDGSVIWKKEIVSRTPEFKIHPSNSYATESPVTDGERVYAYFASVGVVACLDYNGNLAWQRDIGAYRTSSDFGTGSSLALLDGKIFVQCDNEEQSFVCALDTSTGDDVWRMQRSGRTSWSSPMVWTNAVRAELVVCGSGDVTSYDPSTGSVLWHLSGTGGAYSASPTSDFSRIYFGNSGRNSRGPLIAVNAGADGELTLDDIGDTGIAWVAETSAPGMCSPVVVSGRLYVLSRGILSCHNAATGERIFRKRLKNASSVTSSLWASKQHVFALNESGETAVIRVGDELELTGSNQKDGLYWSTPSVVGTSLLLRSAKSLHCIRDQNRVADSSKETDSRNQLGDASTGAAGKSSS